jgi:anti-sigma-K factor RskA
MVHDDVKLLLSAVALGSATPEEAQLVAEHVETCAVCEEQLLEFRETVGMMAALAAPGQISPPPHLKARVMAAVASEQPVREPRRLPRLRWSYFAPAIAAAAAVLVVLLWPADKALPPTPQGRELVVQLAPGADRELAGVDMDITGKTVRVSDVPRAKAGRDWQLWAINGKGQAMPMGVLDKGGSMRVPDGAAVLAITDEPAGGSEQPTGQPQLTASV